MRSSLYMYIQLISHFTMCSFVQIETPDDFGEDEENFEFDWIVSNTSDQDSEKQLPQPGASFTFYLVHSVFYTNSYFVMCYRYPYKVHYCFYKIILFPILSLKSFNSPQLLSLPQIKLQSTKIQGIMGKYSFNFLSTTI